MRKKALVLMKEKRTLAALSSNKTPVARKSLKFGDDGDATLNEGDENSMIEPAASSAIATKSPVQVITAKKRSLPEVLQFYYN